jgi:hypothetical protein
MEHHQPTLGTAFLTAAWCPSCPTHSPVQAHPLTCFLFASPRSACTGQFLSCDEHALCVRTIRFRCSRASGLAEDLLRSCSLIHKHFNLIHVVADRSCYAHRSVIMGRPYCDPESVPRRRVCASPSRSGQWYIRSMVSFSSLINSSTHFTHHVLRYSPSHR